MAIYIAKVNTLYKIRITSYNVCYTKLLRRKDYDSFGLCYILGVYSDSKKNLLQYIKYVNETDLFKDKLNLAVDKYKQISEGFEAAAGKIPFNLEYKPIDEACLPEVVDIIRKCMLLEEDASYNFV